ncbi:MAG: hypothetical protein HY864_00770 [Chloroflexi bacterium]|nr:hypothetical protein [Chloroflexota bacterium]
MMNLLLSRRGVFGANGLLGGAWNTTNSAWRVLGGKAVCTPTLGAELFANTGFDADTNWTKGAGWTISAGKANHAGATAGSLTQAIGGIGNWYRAGYMHESGATNQTYVYFGATTNMGRQHATQTNQQVIAVRRQLSTTDMGLRATTNAVVQADTATAKLITLSDMFASKIANNNATITANIVTGLNSSILFNQPIGVAGWMDSYTSPANFIIAYLNVTPGLTTVTLYLEKCVGGTYTTLTSGVVTYAAGAPLKLTGTVSGGTLTLDAYYNGTQVGTQQTVTDAGIISNTRHGMFGGSEFNNFAYFSLT